MMYEFHHETWRMMNEIHPLWMKSGWWMKLMVGGRLIHGGQNMNVHGKKL